MPLHDKRADQERKADSGVTVLAKKSHEVSEADEDHDVDVLEQGVALAKVVD